MTAPPWYRDPLSCLQSTLAALLLRRGEDPLACLGLSWEFLHVPGDFRPEEFYWPCRYPGDVVRSVMPHHPVGSAWHTATGSDPFTGLEEELAAGRPPLIAVDNFHLPFRPAYHDVHSEHLLVVHRIDRAAGTVTVSDAQPPEFSGPLSIGALRRAWRVGPYSNEQNVFFSKESGRERHRWISVRLDTPFPELTPARLTDVLIANLRGFTDPPHDRSGLAGLRTLTDEIVDRARHGDGRGLVETYTFGWGPQAQTALHGELLRDRGTRWGLPALAEAGRRTEHAAHLWSAVRVHSAHGRSDPRAAAADLARHARRLNDAYERALEAIDEAVPALAGAGIATAAR